MRHAEAAAWALAMVMLLGGASVPAGANDLVPRATVIVAVLDTGADGPHSEFGGYLGQPGVPDPQIVAWWDFGVHGNPAPGQTWDPLTPVPFDQEGHGTGTASLVGGRTFGTCPGVKLAIGKIAGPTGALTGDVVAAVEWATKTVGADIISMSFGSQVPFPERFDDFDEVLRNARAVGVLPVGSAGNGVLGLGVKQPTEVTSPAAYPAVLSVGASGAGGSTTARTVNGYYSNLDPDVIAWGTSVPMARPGGGSTTGSGTSFSAPKVAGHAACLVQAARAAGQDASPDRIEELLKRTARDDLLVPYAVEGYGFVDPDTYEAARVHAVAGTMPPAPLVDSSFDLASATAKWAWTDGLEPHMVLAPLDGPAGSIGPSLPAAVSQGEVYRIPVGTLQHLQVALSYSQVVASPEPLNDLDLYLFQPGAADDGILEINEVVARSTNAAEPFSTEAFAYHAGFSGDHLLLVHGWTVAQEQSFALSATLDGVPASLAFEGDVAILGFF